MNNNGLIEYKESFITKIKKFFIKLFRKSDEKYNNMPNASNENINELNDEENQDKFIEELKVDSNKVNNVIEKNNFLEEIDGNEEALSMLSIDRLKKLEEYYDSVIAENEKKIKKLKET